MSLNRIFPYIIAILSGFFIIKGFDIISDGFSSFNSISSPKMSQSYTSSSSGEGVNVKAASATIGDSNKTAIESTAANDSTDQKDKNSIIPTENSGEEKINGAELVEKNFDNGAVNRIGKIDKQDEKYNNDTDQYNKCLSIFSDNQFLPSEIAVLQEMRHYKDENDNRREWLTLKEKALLAIEKNIDDKLTKLAKQHEAMEKYLHQYGQGSSNQIAKLVKVYESMDPKEAAHIFESLQIEVLIKMAENMKENKLAAIIAKMDVNKAKLLTTSMATQRLKQFQSSDLEE